LRTWSVAEIAREPGRLNVAGRVVFVIIGLNRGIELLIRR
jgi:hypothetical protein